MNIKIEAPDFNEVWLQRRDNAVKNAMEFAEQVRTAQEKWLKEKKIGYALNGIVVFVAIILCVIARNNFPWLIATILLAGVIGFIVTFFMIEGNVLNELDREQQFAVIQRALRELQKCTEIKEAHSTCDNLHSQILEWDHEYYWRKYDIKYLLDDVEYLWDCYCVLCNTILSYKENEYEVEITYADKNGDVHRVDIECSIKENYNVTTDILRWEDEKITFVKKYKGDKENG